MTYFGWEALLLRLRNEPLGRAAHAIVEAAIAGDGTTVFRYAHRREKEMLHLTKLQYGVFIRDYVAPRLRTAKRHEALKEWDGDRHGLLNTVLFTNSTGTEVPVTITLHRTPEGPRGYLFGDYALGAAILKHARSSGDSSLDYFAEAVHAVRLEAPDLQRYGVASLLSVGPQNRSVPWEAMADYWTASLERRESRRRKASVSHDASE
ncbi:MAG: hypothetical protein IT207_03490 [Fimbriimonadaceae bacterium]|nr:hypothetical protein [Fimbriimonadaceae bacterium]